MHIEKTYFTMEEILERWRIPERDLAYLAENDQLRLSVRVHDLVVELGRYHGAAPHEKEWIPERTEIHTGLVDLHAGDAHMLFRCAEGYLTDFRLPDGADLRIAEPGIPVHVMLGDLLVRRDERDRLEDLRGFNEVGVCCDRAGFSASADFRHVYCNGTYFRLGVVQARVVRELHRAAEAGAPWQGGKRLLTLAGSRSMRMADVFKSQPRWRHLIESNGRGQYRLKLDPDPIA